MRVDSIGNCFGQTWHPGHPLMSSKTSPSPAHYSLLIPAVDAREVDTDAVSTFFVSFPHRRPVLCQPLRVFTARQDECKSRFRTFENLTVYVPYGFIKLVTPGCLFHKSTETILTIAKLVLQNHSTINLLLVVTKRM